MANPEPQPDQAEQPNPPDQQVVEDLEMKNEEQPEVLANDPICEIFKGRVKQIITFQGADGQ